MKLLLVDTAGPKGGVLLALSRGNSHDENSDIEIAGEMELHPRQFSAELIPALGGLLRAGNAQLTDVDAFAVVAGPGSFTGLRVGLSAVKALAEVTGKPIVMLSRLAILASMAVKLSCSENAGAAVHVVLDAGRGEFYYGVYRDAGKTRVAESFETLDSLTGKIKQTDGWVIATDASVADAFHSIAGSRLHEVPAPSVRDALLLAVEEWRVGRFHDPVNVDANYLRRSDAVVVVRPKAQAMVEGSRLEESRL